MHPELVEGHSDMRCGKMLFYYVIGSTAFPVEINKPSEISSQAMSYFEN